MAEALDIDSVTTTKFMLNTGTEMPAIGLGTYRIKKADVVYTVVDQALAAGYRMFDTATVYHNEANLGEAFKTLLPKYKLKRDDVFITTKLSPSDHGDANAVQQAYQTSIDNLGLEFIDLYLIHFPGASKLSVDDPCNIEMRNASWASLVKLYDNGLVNAIGVSNYTTRHLKQLLKTNHGVIPAVNQVEWHPFYQQMDLLEFCRHEGIVLQAYSSLGGLSANNDELITHPGVTQVAKKLGVSNAQVLLRWALQQDISVIPKATEPLHIEQNNKLNFTIANEDMRILNDLGSFKIKYAWDPSVVV